MPKPTLPVVPTFVFWETRLTRSLRTKFFLTGVIYPLVCLASLLMGPMSPMPIGAWQSGHWDVYSGLLLSKPTFFYFAPLIIYSMVCLGIWCVKPVRYKHLSIRWGIYTGALLAGLFTIILMFCTGAFGPVFGMMAIAVQMLVVWFAPWIFGNVFRFTILNLLVATTVVAVLTTLVLSHENITDFFAYPFAFLFLIVGGASTMAAITFSRVSRAVWFQSENYVMNDQADKITPRSKLNILAILLIWLSGFFVSWKLAIESMLEEYSMLPETPPDCFISNAAAHGHPNWVGSQIGRSGRLCNLQMARFKFVEFVLAAASPFLHHRFRNIYNFFGPTFARICRKNIWFADIAFIILKPIEWFAVSLQLIFHIEPSKIMDTYMLKVNKK